jgi:hypothetical protein
VQRAVLHNGVATDCLYEALVAAMGRKFFDEQKRVVYAACALVAVTLEEVRKHGHRQ